MRTGGQRLKILAVLCALSVAVSVRIARSTAPERYELSIIDGTPLLVWVLLIGTGIIGITGLLVFSDSKTRFIFGGIGSLAIITIVWLPLIRGYFFFDEEDAMGHWGTLKVVADGRVPLSDIFYPGIISASLGTAEITGTSLRWSLLFTSVTIITISVMLVVVAARNLLPNRQVGAIALVLALFFAPLNPLNVMVAPHPSTQAIFYSALPLAMFLIYHRTNNRIVALPFILSLVGLYAYHPQQLVNFLLFLVALGLANTFFSKGLGFDAAPTKQPIALVLATGIFVIIAVLNHMKFQGVIGWVARSIRFDLNTGGVSGRTSSLSALDISIPLLLLKAGAKNLVLGVGALAAVLLWWRHRDSTTVPLPSYAIGLLPVVGIGVIFYVIGGGNQLVRYVGMVVMLVVPLAAIGFQYLTNWLPEIRFGSQSATHLALVGLLLLGLVAAVPTIHHDPYTARYGHHVTEGQYAGFETSFEYADTDTTIHHIRSRAFRYHQATHGYTPDEPWPGYLPPRSGGHVPDHFDGGVSESPHYITITASDVQRDAELYQGFRYSHGDFQELEASSDYGLVYNNAHLDLYLNEEGGGLSE